MYRSARLGAFEEKKCKVFSSFASRSRKRERGEDKNKKCFFSRLGSHSFPSTLRSLCSSARSSIFLALQSLTLFLSRLADKRDGAHEEIDDERRPRQGSRLADARRRRRLRRHRCFRRDRSLHRRRRNNRRCCFFFFFFFFLEALPARQRRPRRHQKGSRGRCRGRWRRWRRRRVSRKRRRRRVYRKRRRRFHFDEQRRDKRKHSDWKLRRRAVFHGGRGCPRGRGRRGDQRGGLDGLDRRGRGRQGQKKRRKRVGGSCVCRRCRVAQGLSLRRPRDDDGRGYSR